MTLKRRLLLVAGAIAMCWGCTSSIAPTEPLDDGRVDGTAHSLPLVDVSASGTAVAGCEGMLVGSEKYGVTSDGLLVAFEGIHGNALCVDTSAAVYEELTTLTRYADALGISGDRVDPSELDVLALQPVDEPNPQPNDVAEPNPQPNDTGEEPNPQPNDTGEEPNPQPNHPDHPDTTVDLRAKGDPNPQPNCPGIEESLMGEMAGG